MSAVSATPVVSSLSARSVRWFFSQFFRLLILAVSLSQWWVLWWLLPPLQRAPVVVHIIGPAAIYIANRRSVLRARRDGAARTGAAWLPRLYYACAFTCLFCALFLLLNSTVWVVARTVLGGLAAHVYGVPARVALHTVLDRDFRRLADCGIAVIGLAFAYGYTIGQLRLCVRRRTLPLRHFGAALGGLRIVQISDIHIGRNVEPAQLEEFVARVNAEQPDLVCITGDIADSAAADFATYFPLLAGLRARRGVYAILGDHDHYAGAERVERALRHWTPFTVLRDQRVVIDVDGARLHIIGLDDRGHDWARGLSEVEALTTLLAGIPAAEPMLLLSHRPDVFLQAARAGIGLTLSGHTHGGQLAIPWFNGRFRNFAEFITAFDRGLYEQDGCYLYVNCGLGVTGQRIRLCTPREITVIEVAVAAGAAAVTSSVGALA